MQHTIAQMKTDAKRLAQNINVCPSIQYVATVDEENEFIEVRREANNWFEDSFHHVEEIVDFARCFGYNITVSTDDPFGRNGEWVPVRFRLS